MADDWKDAFKTNTTRVRFELSLTRPMLEMLCASSDDVHWDRTLWGGLTYPDNWMATEHALTKRGLLRRRPPQVIKGLKGRADGETWSQPPWELTPAGVALIELLKVGGLFIQARGAQERMAARKGRH